MDRIISKKVNTGMLITFEGIDCSGKGVQSKRLLEYLKSLGKDAILIREPGGTVYGEALRAMLKHPEMAISGVFQACKGHEDFPNLPTQNTDLRQRSSFCELLMFLAARADFVDQIIKPALEAGKIVIADRFIDSTLAYQCGGRFYFDQAITDFVWDTHQIILQGVYPDITFLLDISIQEMLKRRAKNQKQDAHFEKTCDEDFFERVAIEYRAIREATENIVTHHPTGYDAKKARQYIVLNGEKGVEEIATAISQQVSQTLKEKKQ